MVQELFNPGQPPERCHEAGGAGGSSELPVPGLPRNSAHARVLYLTMSEHLPRTNCYRKGLAAKYLSSHRPDFGFWVAPFSLMTCSQEWHGAGCCMHPKHPAQRPGTGGLCISRAVNSAKYITCNNVPRIYSCLSGYILKCLMMCGRNAVISS